MGRKKRLKTSQSNRADLVAILREVRKIERRTAMQRYGEDFLDCDEAAEICAKIMREKGLPAKVVVGTVRGQSHAWVESNGMIVDPTADQFRLPKLVPKAKAPLYEELPY